MRDYLQDNVRATLALDLPRGKYRAWWLDTKTGRMTALTFAHGGGERQLDSPAFANDIALGVVADHR